MEPTNNPQRTVQLRTYTLKPGTLPQWVSIWRDQIKPLREGLGFTVPAAWSVPEDDRFIWLMAYEGPRDWAELDRMFHDSPERRTMNPDPADLIVSIATCFVEPIE